MEQLTPSFSNRKHYNESMKSLSKKTTLLFLIDENKILLAMKKRGFGAGRWNGVGGKPENNELIEQTAIRECYEEIEVLPRNIRQVATLNFYFPRDKSDWNQQVLVYICKEWQGNPAETDEMKPAWYSMDSIPYESMWQDDKYWLPEVLKGNNVEAEFVFDENDNVLSHEINIR